jgi:hypothetical protein
MSSTCVSHVLDTGDGTALKYGSSQSSIDQYVQTSETYKESQMNPAGKESKRSGVALALSWAGMLALALTLPAFSKDMPVTLSGDQEVPPVTTSASGTGTISVGADNAVSGSIMIKGVNATAAHIHEAAKGKNGPVIMPLTKSGDTTFTVPTGAKLTDAQMQSLQSGNLYVNVHSAANPNGEIRAQLGP